MTYAIYDSLILRPRVSLCIFSSRNPWDILQEVIAFVYTSTWQEGKEDKMMVINEPKSGERVNVIERVDDFKGQIKNL